MLKRKAIFATLIILTLLVAFVWAFNIYAASAYTQIEAESFSSQSGVQTETCSDTGGGQNVSYIANGDYTVYSNIDFGSGAASFSARVASANSGGNIEIRLDSITGTLVGTCAVSGTGGWQTWVTKNCSVSGASGVHTVYLKFTGGTGDLFNLNWFTFTAAGSTSVWYQNFESGTGFSAGTNATVTLSTGNANSGNNCVKLTISASGDPGTTSKCVNVTPQSGSSINASAYNYLIFYVNDTQGANTIRVTITDTGNASWNGWTSAQSVMNAWTKISLPLSSVTGINKAAIKQINIGEWNAGTYYFDDIYLAVNSADGLPGGSQTPAPTPTATRTPTPTTGIRSAFNQIEAESFNSQSGIQTETCTDTGGGQDVAYIGNGDYTVYTGIDFGTGAASFSARVASANSGGNIEIRLDSLTGTLVGTCVVPGTGGWQTWATQSCSVSGASGVHTLYLKFTGGTTDLFNLNWIKFSTTIAPSPSPAGNHMEIMTWVPAYSQSVWMSALQANTGGTYNPRNTLTRIAGQFYQIQSNGGLNQIISDADQQWTVNFCHNNGIKYLICVFNYINNWDWQTAASAFAYNRTTLINNLVNEVNQWGADGVDIDFEGNEATDSYRSEFNTFIRELGTRLHSMGKELTVDVFANVWNQPNTNWWPDWAGYVDGVNSMGYDGLFGGGPGWQAYRWQQDTALNAGYKTYQFQMGMPGWTGNWGSGGLGTSALAHVNELLSGNYNRYPTSICIWDAQFNGSGWLSAQVWDGLHQMRMKTGN